MTPLQRLRAETAAAHAAAENAFDWRARASTLGGYRGMLGALYGFHAAWEPWAAALLNDPPFFDERRRTHLLADDLRHLGTDPSALRRLPCPVLPTLHGRAAALGSMYVVEGSTLGGRLIARQAGTVLGLRPGAGLSYHNGHGARSGPMWRTFCARLDTALRPGPDMDAAVAAALETFQSLARVLAATS